MDEQNATIEAIKAEIAEVRASDELTALDKARKVLELNDKLAVATAELAEIVASEEALAALDAGDAEEEVADEVTEEDSTEAGDGDGDEEVADDEAGDAGDEGTEVADETVETTTEAPVALAASASDTDVSHTAEPTKGSAFTLTAAASFGNVAAGKQLDEGDVIEQLNFAARSQEGRARLFSVNRFDQDAKVASRTNSAIENSRIIAEAQASKQQPLALTAAACFCGPDEVRPDFDAIGLRSRPVAGIFPTVPINGGFRYLKDIAINPDSESVNLWTCADQDLVDPEDDTTWKQCSELDCFDEEEAYPYMITGCTIVQRTHQWAHPEQVRTWLDKLQVEYARKAETALLDIIDANAGAALTVGNAGGMMANHGVKAQLIYALANLAGSLGYQFRAEALAGHTVIVPRGLIDAIVGDERLRGFGGEEARQEIIRQVSTDFGVNLVERLDEPTSLAAASQTTVTNLNAGGQIDAVGELLRTPFTRIYVLRPDQFVHAEGTLVGADWHVDRALLLQNRMLYFWENLELLEHTGLEKAYKIDLYGCINGALSDLVIPPCVEGAGVS